MTTPTIQEIIDKQAQRRFAAEIAATNALQAAGGLASDKTLRDEFAMAALSNEWCSHTDECVPSDTAKDAYHFAAAMLEARKTTGEGEA
jgi:hypothetical protein